MQRIIVIEYNESLLQSLKNRQIVVKTDTLEQIEHKYSESQRNNNVMAMCVLLPFTSISQIDFKQEWSQIPMVVYAHNIGDYEKFFSKVDLIRSLNIRFFLSSESETAFTDLKIMASLGVDCGIYMKEGTKMSDESFLDLASYYYMSPVAHATIEPFAFIQRHLTEEKNENFESIYFKNPMMFISATSIEEIEDFDACEDSDFDIKLRNYYKHFIELDTCSKCPAFKICDKKMMSRLDDCQSSMAEIYEYAELRNEMNKQKEPKTICQL